MIKIFVCLPNNVKIVPDHAGMGTGFVKIIENGDIHFLKRVR